MIKELCLAFICSIGLISTVSASTLNESILQKLLDEQRATQGKPWGVVVPGLSAAIRVASDNSAKIVKAVSGYSNPPSKTPLQVQDRFHMGSITKTFTSALIMQLDQEKALSLNDPISKWIDYPNGEHITISMLLGHTSGIPSFDDLPGHDRNNTPKESIRLAANHKAVFAPGSKWSYSNTNYTILSVIAEKVTKSSWAKLIEKRFFKPLNLTQTAVWTGSPIPASTTGSRLRCGMVHEPKCKKKPGFDLLAVTDGNDWRVAWAAGAIVSTPRDIAHWIHALLNGNVVDEAHKKLLTTVSTQSVEYLKSLPAFGKLKWTGTSLGLFRYEIEGVGIAWGHEGLINGFAANTAYIVKTGDAVALASNFQQTDSFTVLGELARIRYK